MGTRKKAGEVSSPRIAVGGIYHETNTFAPGITTLDHFHSEWVEGDGAFAARYAGSRTSMGGVLQAAAEQGATVAAGLYTSATPSAMVDRETMEHLMHRLVDSIDASADGLILIMHGAMVSEPYPDAEGECLRLIRQKVGKDFPIALTLDLHANISLAMVEQADIIIGYDTYPHVDMYERAIEAFHKLTAYIAGQLQPVHAYGHTSMLIAPQAMTTGSGAMRELMELASQLEETYGLVNITVAGGFPYSDVPDAGMSFVVTADGDAETAQRCLAVLMARMSKEKARFNVELWKPEDALAEAWRVPDGVIILAEGSDNVGGGAPADATHLLARLVDPPQRALQVLYDPEAVRIAAEAGIGATIRLRVGGKTDVMHGEPVTVAGKVRLLSDGRYRHVGPYNTGHYAEMGKTAVLECGRLTLVVTGQRTAPWDIGHLLSLGVDPSTYKVIVVKSAIAWQAAFGALARAVYQLDTPGCCSANLHHFQYRLVRRPVYPLDELPEG
ncbi:microcystin degradation protein MlrC [Paenibacillus sp. 598K]|uniref:M81 family metallopeptidase n=1 Tax=Paenibacillus sp. 598K TaxID=1117987 RepID=UPI000FF99470|nr:M81 family metallopeptidase [Paenibacillus sp. 598K]GBF74350.1 microcystin degradation protein MlrC [Paenibacillus sp. 598K]